MKEKKKLSKTKWIIGLLVIIYAGCTIFFIGVEDGQWLLYSDSSYSGQIVDAENGKPIEDVIVVGLWDLTKILSHGPDGYAKIQVVTTDHDGRFKLPSWINFKPWKITSLTDNISPKIVIYRPGYKVLSSHRLKRAGYPDDYSKKVEEKAKIKEKYSLNPAKLEKVYTDEERYKNYIDFSSSADFPEKHYNKRQSKIIIKALEKEVLQITEQFSEKKYLLRSTREMKEYWGGD